MRTGCWLGSVLQVCFSALKLFLWFQVGHLTHKNQNPVPFISKGFFQTNTVHPKYGRCIHLFSHDVVLVTLAYELKGTNKLGTKR